MCPPSPRWGIEERIENAVGHNPTDRPTIWLSIVSESVWVALTVEDNGTGIPAAEQTAFGRGYETPLDHSQGLGLWLVHLTVEKSGGELVIKDGDRGGAKVVVKLPEVN